MNTKTRKKKVDHDTVYKSSQPFIISIFHSYLLATPSNASLDFQSKQKHKGTAGSRKIRIKFQVKSKDTKKQLRNKLKYCTFDNNEIHPKYFASKKKKESGFSIVLLECNNRAQ